MGRARRWECIALSGFVAACLFLMNAGPVQAAEVLDWDVSGYLDAGGMYRFGEFESSKFQNYRDMDNGFIGDFALRGEKKNAPYFFELYAKNPARDDQLYTGALGRYGMFRLDLGWNRTPVDISNSANTIFQQNSDQNNLPPDVAPPLPLGTLSLRTTIANTMNPGQAPPAVSQPSNGAAVTANAATINAMINGLLRPVNLRYNADVGFADLKYTPLADLRFDLDYTNIHNQGQRPIGTVIGSPGGPITELSVPLDNWTNEVKFGVGYARPNWALQFNYIGSFFTNDFNGYTWDNPLATQNTFGCPGGAGCAPGATGAGFTARDRISAAPDNSANTFSLTGTANLPLRTNINGTFAYTLLRQDQGFNLNTQNPALNPTNQDLDGNTSPNAQSNLVLANILATSRPISVRTAALDTLSFTARYRYFEYQNDMPEHTFAAVIPTGQGPTSEAANEDSTVNPRYTRQDVGFDVGYRPIQWLSLRAGYAYEHWNRADYEDQSFSNNTNSFIFSSDVTPVDWFLGRVSYTYANRTISGFENPSFLGTPLEPGGLPQSIKFNYAPAVSNRVDALLQFTPWETVIPSISGGYSDATYHDNAFGLLNNNYWTVGFNLDWSPVKQLTFSGDFSYEEYNYNQGSRNIGFGAALPGSDVNNWMSKSRDQFYNLGLNARVDIIPKKFNVTLGYIVTWGFTVINNSNPDLTPATAASATAYPYNGIKNILQTFKIVGNYYLTEKLSLRGGFAYERYTERDFARDPMMPFMGFYERAVPGGPLVPAGIQSVYLGATVPNYEAYIFAGFVRYEF